MRGVRKAEAQGKEEEKTKGLRCTLVPKVYYTLIVYKGITYFYIMENTYNPINLYKHKRDLNMTNKGITLLSDSKIYDEHKKYCEEKGTILSKQFELFMKEKIKKFNGGKND